MHIKKYSYEWGPPHHLVQHGACVLVRVVLTEACIHPRLVRVGAAQVFPQFWHAPPLPLHPSPAPSSPSLSIPLPLPPQPAKPGVPQVWNHTGKLVITEDQFAESADPPLRGGASRVEAPRCEVDKVWRVPIASPETLLFEAKLGPCLLF